MKQEYDALISQAKLRGNDKSLVGFYTEEHHIIPRCMGGLDTKDNLVLLSGEEHYTAHKLLAKIHPENNDLQFAWFNMCTTKDSLGRKYTVSSSEYEEARIAFSKSSSDRWSDSEFRERTIESMKASASTPEAKLKRSKATKAALSTQSSKTKLSNSMKDVWSDQNERDKRISSLKEVMATDEYKQNLSLSMKEVKRVSPIWHSPMKEELFNLWKENGSPKCGKFNKLAVSFGYPDVNYGCIIKSYFSKNTLP